MHDKAAIEKGVEYILHGLLGPEWEADRNYSDTPRRVADFYEEMFRKRGYATTTFPDDYDQMIVFAHHEAYTLCPHHLLPVRFDVSLAYIPHGAVLGLSKLARLIENHFEEPILQEVLTDSIADELMKRLSPEPLGSAVLVYGEHSCMQIRGPKTTARIATQALRGVFLEKPEAREEFLALVRRAG